MPPSEIRDMKITALTQWVKLGLPWPKEEPPKAAGGAPAFDFDKRRREHWAWQPIKKPNPPQTRDSAWPRNEVDAFLLAGLEQHQLRPSPAADRATLIRRVYLDLIGRRRAAEIDFLATSPQGAEKVVDRFRRRRDSANAGAHRLDFVRYTKRCNNNLIVRCKTPGATGTTSSALSTRTCLTINA
jgi:hypothetical protein